MYDYTTAIQPIQAIAVDHGTLCKDDGIFRVDVIGKAVNPSDDSNLPIGYTMNHYAEISNSNGDDDLTNNETMYKLVTPGIDLKTTITGSPE